jgi:hypothetical protein
VVVVRFWNPVDDRPRMELGHPASMSEAELLYDLYPIGVDRPRRGVIDAVVVCGTCGEECVVRLLSRGRTVWLRWWRALLAVALVVVAFAVANAADGGAPVAVFAVLGIAAIGSVFWLFRAAYLGTSDDGVTLLVGPGHELCQPGDNRVRLTSDEMIGPF